MKKLLFFSLLLVLVAGCSAEKTTKESTETKFAKTAKDTNEPEKPHPLSISDEELDDILGLVNQLYDYEKQKDVDSIAKMTAQIGSENHENLASHTAILLYEEIIANNMIIEEFDIKEMKKLKEYTVLVTVDETRAGKTEEAELLLVQDDSSKEWVFDFDGIIDQYSLNYVVENEYGKFGNFYIIEYLDGRKEFWFEIENTTLDFAIYLGNEDFRYTLVTDKGTYTEESFLNSDPNVLESAKYVTPNSPPASFDVTFTNLEGEIAYFMFENIEFIPKSSTRGTKHQMMELKVPFTD